MGPAGHVTGMAQRLVLLWRSRFGHETAERHLEALLVAMEAHGWRCVRFYREPEFPISTPVLWIHAPGAPDDIGIKVVAFPTPQGMWGYHEPARGGGLLFPCGTPILAAEHIDQLLRRRMFPP